MLELSRYIHLNPVRAQIVKKPEDYLWSSYNVYMGKTNDNIIHCEEILSFFDSEKARDDYKKYVESQVIL